MAGSGVGGLRSGSSCLPTLVPCCSESVQRCVVATNGCGGPIGQESRLECDTASQCTSRTFGRVAAQIASSCSILSPQDLHPSGNSCNNVPKIRNASFREGAAAQPPPLL